MKKVRIIRLFGLLILLACSIAFPLVFSNPAVTSVAVFTLIFAGAATAWNIFSGYTGYISLGHTSFYGIGAYTLAILCRSWNIQGGYEPFLLFPLAGLAAGISAIPLGWIALRTRRVAFIVVTIAIFFILQLLAYNLPSLTEGSNGMVLPFPNDWNGYFFNLPFYYVALAILLLGLGISWWIRHSKYGLGLLAIRDDEERVLSLGVHTERYKIGAFVISGFLVGLAGATYAYYIGSVSPPSGFDPSFDITVALMAFFGGITTLWGPVLGALLLEPLQQYITIQFGGNGFDLIIYGGLFLAILLLLPEGIIPTLRRLWTTWLNTRRNISSRKVTDQEGAFVKEESVLTQSGEG